ISALPEMQPTAVAAAAPAAPSGPVKLSAADFRPPADKPGTAQVSDQTGGPRELASPDTFERFKALEEVQFQQMREESRRAQREAMDRFMAGDAAPAMDILGDFSARLADARLSPEKVALLRRPVEGRLAQFRTLKAQRDFEKEQTTGLSNATNSERVREAERQ